MTRATSPMSVARAAASPAAYLVEIAPQLVVVGLAHAALVAVACALDVAHPNLTALRKADRANRAERFASEIVELAARCADLLHDYGAAIACEIDRRLDDDCF